MFRKPLQYNEKPKHKLERGNSRLTLAKQCSFDSFYARGDSATPCFWSTTKMDFVPWPVKNICGRITVQAS
jgi:hypothetical protein